MIESNDSKAVVIQKKMKLIFDHYQAFLDAVHDLTDPKEISQGLLFLDTGMLWIREHGNYMIMNETINKNAH